MRRKVLRTTTIFGRSLRHLINSIALQPTYQTLTPSGSRMYRRGRRVGSAVPTQLYSAVYRSWPRRPSSGNPRVCSIKVIQCHVLCTRAFPGKRVLDSSGYHSAWPCHNARRGSGLMYLAYISESEKQGSRVRVRVTRCALTRENALKQSSHGRTAVFIHLHMPAESHTDGPGALTDHLSCDQQTRPHQTRHLSRIGAWKM